MEKVFEIYIRTTPERLWEAITDPTIRAKYHFGAARVRLDARLVVRAHPPRRRRPARRGRELDVDPPRRLVQTMNASGATRSRARGHRG